VLSAKEMENVLFDIHLAEAAIESDYRLYSRHDTRETRRKQLYDAVFQKHGITMQTFDTSLVWYSGHLENYIKIYDKLDARYALLQGQLDEEKDRISAALRSGTYAINRWQGPYSAQLDAYSSLKNHFLLRIDSLLPLNATISELQFDALGITPETRANVLFCIHLKDTFLMKNQPVLNNGDNLVSLNTDSLSKQAIESVWGVIYLSKSPQDVIIHNIQVRLTTD
jgi:hypothetical protein